MIILHCCWLLTFDWLFGIWVAFAMGALPCHGFATLMRRSPVLIFAEKHSTFVLTFGIWQSREWKSKMNKNHRKINGGEGWMATGHSLHALMQIASLLVAGHLHLSSQNNHLTWSSIAQTCHQSTDAKRNPFSRTENKRNDQKKKN